MLERIVAGEVTLAFRRWKRPQTRSGGQLRTQAGVLAFDDVRVVDEGAISEADAMAAGYTSREALIRELNRWGDGDIYRLTLRLAGEDPRIALRESAELPDDDMEQIQTRLSRFDRRETGPWTERTLRLIEAHPATRATELAAETGRETLHFKTDVRKLKELGLTESLGTGYRLSPRGQAYLERLGD